MNNTLSDQIFTEELYNIKPSNTTVILTKAWHELNYEEKEQLQKISDALKQRINPGLCIDAFNVIHQPQLDINQLSIQPNKVIYFGAPLKGLNQYELIETNKMKMVLSESLEDLISNDQARQKLWKALQQLFTA